jgi:hypothetical protein
MKHFLIIMLLLVAVERWKIVPHMKTKERLESGCCDQLKLNLNRFVIHYYHYLLLSCSNHQAHRLCGGVVADFIHLIPHSKQVLPLSS